MPEPFPFELPPGVDPQGRLIFENHIFKTHDTLYSDFSYKNKLSNSGIMTNKKEEMDQTIKAKSLPPKKFIKNRLLMEQNLLY